MSLDATPTNERLEDSPRVAGVGVILAKRWRLKKNLASGGYGDVWYAEDTDTNQPYAIKLLRPDAGNNDPGALARLRFEAEILEKLEHPNIVRVYGFHESPYGEFLAMEYLDGLAIDQWLKSKGPVDPLEAISLIGQLLGALEVAHENGILHRDIKPENILLVGKDKPQAKLVDFGIAKVQASFEQKEGGVTMVQTRAGGFMGTPRYAAPEQAVGDPMSPSSDLFALGLVAAEWLTGVGRLTGTHAEVMQKLLDGSPIGVSDCPVQWHLWLQKILDKNPERRFQSAEEARVSLAMVRDFESMALALPTRAPKPSPPPSQNPSEFFNSGAPLELDYDRVRPSSPANRIPGPTTPTAPSLSAIEAPPDRKPFKWMMSDWGIFFLLMVSGVLLSLLILPFVMD